MNTEALLDEAVELLRPLGRSDERIAAFLAKASAPVVTIRTDPNPYDPRRENDYPGVMFFQHRRYTLGDKDAEDAFVDGKLRDDVAVCLPVYMYDHSGITVSHKPFSDPWDSGLLGVHYITKKVLEEDFSGNEEWARLCLKAELEEYDQYLRGNVWFVDIETASGKPIESCGGFIGDNLDDTGILDNFSSEYKDAIIEAWEHRYDD